MEQSPKPIDDPSSEPLSEPELVPSKPVGTAEVFPDISKPEEPPKKTLFQLWFNPESKFGRFNRTALRTLVIIIGLFALGVIAMYFVRYRPLLTRYEAAQTELESARQNLANLTVEVGGLRSQAGTLQTSFAGEQVHVTLLTVIRDAALARAELLAGSPKTASTALERGKKALTSLEPVMKAANPDLAVTIQGRLDLALTEITADPDTAADDLVILSEKLGEMEKLLFPAAK